MSTMSAIMLALLKQKDEAAGSDKESENKGREKV